MLVLFITQNKLLAQCTTSSQIGGLVFSDYNANGFQNDFEEGVIGITVTAYDGTTSYGPTTTNAAGEFVLSVPDGTAVRVEFTNLPNGLQATRAGSGSGTNVAFVTSGATDGCAIQFGVNYPTDYCQENPAVAVPCYINGNPIAQPPGTAANADILVTFGYNNSGTSPMPDHIAFGSEMGSVWGVAYNRRTEKLFTGAFLKRFMGLGQQGTGGIYVTDFSTNTPSNNDFINLQNLGVNTGTIPARDLPPDLGNASRDADAFDLVGKIGLGDLDLSDDGNTLWAINLEERSLVEINMTAYNQTGIPPTATNITSFNVPDPGCTNGVFRPFALKYHRGNLYVGGVCTGENGGSRNDLSATIYEFNPANDNFTTVISFSLDYNKGDLTPFPDNISDNCDHFEPWTSDYNDFYHRNLPNGICYPQAILSDIEFDTDGSIIVGFMDRAGHQLGRENLSPSGGDLTLGTGAAGGDILRIQHNNGTFTIENGGFANGNGCGATADGSGMGGGEFYCGDSRDDGEEETSMGSLALLPGTNNVVSTVLNPFTTNSGGVVWLSNTTGDRTDRYQIYNDSDNSANQNFFGKAHGLGDIELLCNPAPITVGDRLWADVDEDGVQDPDEPGISDVCLRLYDGNGNLVASTTTATDGSYSFTNLNPNTNYVISLCAEQYSPANGLTVNDINFGAVTTANTGEGSNPEMNDSDAFSDNNSGIFDIDANSLPYIPFSTGDPGETNFDLDIGISESAPVPCPNYLISLMVEQESICSGTSITITIEHTSDAGTLEILTNIGSILTGNELYGNDNGGAVTVEESVTTQSGTTSTTITIELPPNTSNAPIPYNLYAILDEGNPNIVNPGCLPTVTTPIVVRPVPTANVSSIGPFCENEGIQTLFGTPAGGTWGGAANANGSINPSELGAGTYTVTYTFSDAAGCSDDDQITVIINPLPDININPAGPYCTSEGAQSLTATPTGGTWTGDVSATGSFNPSQMGVGTYSATYTVTTAQGCSDSESITFVVENLPTVAINPTGSFCTDSQPQQLTATPVGGTWGGVASPTGMVSPALLGAGSYVVTYNFTNATGCAGSDQITVVVNPLPNVSIAPISAPLCEDDGIQQLTASPVGGTWGGVANAQGQVDPTALGTGTHTVTYTFTDANGCTNDNQMSFTITPLPDVNINPAGPFCADDGIQQLTASPVGGTWSGAANSQGQINPATMGTGTFTITYTFTDASGCTNTDEITVIVNDEPTGNITPAGPYCVDAGIQQLTAAPAGGTWGGVANANGQINPNSLGVGQHVVTYQFTNANGCGGNDQITITVNPLPTVNITQLNPVCLDAGTQTLSATPAGGTWGGVANAQGQIDPTALGAGTHTVTYTFTDANSCTNDDQMSFTINPLPNVSISPAGPYCEDEGTQTLSATPVGGTWGGAANAQGQINPSTTGTGTFTVTYTFTDASGCSNSDQITIVVNDEPVVNITPAGPYCVDAGIQQLTAAPVGGTWGGVANANGQINPSSLGVGQHVVTYQFTNANGCGGNDQITITVNPLPTINITQLNPVCLDAGTQTLNATPAGGTWGGVANAQGQVNPAALGAGTHTVTYTFTDANNCTSSDQMSFTVNPLPNVSVSPAGPYCLDAGVQQLSATPAGGTWGGAANALGQINPSSMGAGSFTVTYSFTDASGCTSSDQITVVVNDLPAVNINPAGPYCVDAGMQQLTASPAGGTWGGVANAQGQIDPAILGVGTHVVTYAFSNAAACSNSDQITITVNPLPNVSISPMAPVCLDAGVQQLTASPVGGTWGDVANAQGQITPVALGAGTHTVTYTFSDANNCTSSDQMTFTINPLPNVNINPAGPYCVDAGIQQLTASPAGGTWGGAANTQGQINPAALGEGTHLIIYNFTDANGCSDSDDLTIVINGLPNVSIDPVGDLCFEQGIIQLTASPAGGTWGGVANAQGQVNTSDLGVGNFTVTYSFSNANGCSASTQTQISITRANGDAGPNQNICAGECATLTATGGIEYEWSTGENTQNISVSPSTTTTYSVTISNAEGCKDIDEVTVFVGSASVQASPNQTICAGQSTQLSAQGDGNMVWSTNETGASITVNPLVTTTYSVVLTSADGCTATDYVTVNVSEVIADAGTERIVCEGETVELAAQGGTNYQWSNGQNGQTITINPMATCNTYTVTVSNEFGCTDTDEVGILVGHAVANAGANRNICVGETAVLTATGGVSYLWNTQETSATISVSPIETTTYNVFVTDENGCTDSDEVTVFVGNVAASVSPQNAEICAGECINLVASGGLVYQWDNGMSGAEISVSPSITTTYTVTVSDANGCTDIVSTTVNVQNCTTGLQERPDAVDDNTLTQANEPITIEVLENDDPNGDPVTITAIGQPANGTVELVNGILIYTPNPNFEGTDTFTYQICNSLNQCDEAVVTIQVRDDECSSTHFICTEPLTPQLLCPEFCDLLGENVVVTNAQTTFNCSIQLVGDNCVQYTALPLFAGVETIEVIGCTSMGICDTVIYTIQVTDCDGGGLAAPNSTGKLANPSDLSLEFDEDRALSLSKIAPSPTNHYTNFYFTAKDSEVQIDIYDLAGKQIDQQVVTSNSGINVVKLDVSSYVTGTYIAKLTTNTDSISAKFVKN